MKELRGMIKEKADGGDDLAKGVQDTFGEKPDGLLVRFIRARKYDVPRAFDLMKGTSGESSLPLSRSLSGLSPPYPRSAPHVYPQATCASGKTTPSCLRT